ncbi:MAG: hypothetical protein JWQ77_1566 [Jatrophihabitans sp.]|nr:hypothetical protein [Jatrophihabitans sp.]
MITVVGEVDVEVASQLGTAGVKAVAAADAACAVIVVDLDGVRFLDSSGLAALVSIANAAADVGKSVQLRSVHERAAKILKITGLDTTFDVQLA